VSETYRQKAHTVAAMQWTGDNQPELKAWLDLWAQDLHFIDEGDIHPDLIFSTGDGYDYNPELGDWIVRYPDHLGVAVRVLADDDFRADFECVEARS